MKKNTKRILAIDPGTRYCGFALLEGDDLIHYGVKTLRRSVSSSAILREGKKFIQGLLEDFHPDILVVEKTHFAKNRKSVLLNAFVKQISALGKRKGLSVHSIAANTVRKAVCGNGAASKADVARAMVMRFPELRPNLTSDKKWKERYHQNMFDAVAIALATPT